MPVPNINNPKEKAPTNNVSGEQGMVSKEIIRLISEKGIILNAPFITISAESIHLNGNVSVNGTLYVNGTPVP